jgi:hypothetical protein
MLKNQVEAAAEDYNTLDFLITRCSSALAANTCRFHAVAARLECTECRKVWSSGKEPQAACPLACLATTFETEA